MTNTIKKWCIFALVLIPATLMCACDASSTPETTVTPTPHEHVAVTDQQVKPTCTENGFTEGTHCSVCGEIIVEQQVIPALGHYEVTVPSVEPNCTREGRTESKQCIECGVITVMPEVIPKLHSNIVIYNAKEATCSSPGRTYGEYCADCSTWIERSKVIQRQEHNYANDICTVCGEKKEDQAKMDEEFMKSVAHAKMNIQKDHNYIGHVNQIFTYDIREGYNGIQGGMFDGMYYYTSAIRYGTPEVGYFNKLDTKGNIVYESDELPLDHMNDVTYIKKWDRYLVAHCQSADNHYYEYSTLKPGNLSVDEYLITLEKPFFGIDYNEKRDMFASAEWSGGTIDIWDGDLELIDSIDVTAPAGTSQGLCTDENYIYCARCWPNNVTIFDWEGNQIAVVTLDMTEGEPEHISVVNGVMFIGGNIAEDGKNSYGYFAYVVLEDVTK